MVKICYNLFTTMSFKQFRPGFQQESILLHRGNVENYVENVEIVRLIVLEVFDYVVNGIFQLFVLFKIFNNVLIVYGHS